MYQWSGAWDQGGPGGPGPPLESRIYSVKILKIGKISFSLLVGPPLGKIRSLAPAYISYYSTTPLCKYGLIIYLL